MTKGERPTAKEVGFFEIRELATLLWKSRVVILATTLVFGVAGAGLYFLVPKTFEAVATVFPVSSAQSSVNSSYSDLAAMVGVTIPGGAGGSDPTKTISALLSSRLLAERVVLRLDLVDRFSTERPNQTEELRLQAAVKTLQDSFSFMTDPLTGVISVTVRLGEAELAQLVANTILQNLDELLAEKSLTTNSKKRELLLRQAEEQKAKVDFLQAQMAQFQRDTSLLDPKTQSNQALLTYSGLIQQKMELEMALSTATASYASDNPRIAILKNQLENMEKQITLMKNQVDGDLPSLRSAPDNLVLYQNLARDLEIASKIYTALLGSVEQAKLNNDSEQIYVEVLDPALRPMYGTPSFSLILLASIVLGFVGSLAYILLLDAIGKVLRSTESKSQKSPV